MSRLCGDRPEVVAPLSIDLEDAMKPVVRAKFREMQPDLDINEGFLLLVRED
jgi:hypothetical protein